MDGVNALREWKKGTTVPGWDEQFAERRRIAGQLWVVEPPAVSPGSWLNEPEYAEFLDAYNYAARHFPILATLLGGMSVEDACLVWKCIETGRAVVRFRERQGRLRA
ncbi:hypothetical protein [Lentzea kentuckyensis]|uniref:hypothetical protein n=1 Tax=Lentzea kentuckyensis TaxID=360086 RepID=UPI0013027A9D|nr:hypothetical protein [Lentzea kentuckyensis]